MGVCRQLPQPYELQQEDLRQAFFRHSACLHIHLSYELHDPWPGPATLRDSNPRYVAKVAIRSYLSGYVKISHLGQFKPPEAMQ